MAIEVRTDLIRLPSGVTVDLFNLDLSACRTPDDAWEVGQALQEKIIDIEYQLEAYGLGYWRDEPITPQNIAPKLWEARAKKALAWSKIQKADAQNRFQKLSKAAKGSSEAAKGSSDRERQREFGQTFIDVARAMLSDEVFAEVMAATVEIRNRFSSERPKATAA